MAIHPDNDTVGSWFAQLNQYFKDYVLRYDGECFSIQANEKPLSEFGGVYGCCFECCGGCTEYEFEGEGATLEDAVIDILKKRERE